MADSMAASLRFLAYQAHHYWARVEDKELKELSFSTWVKTVELDNYSIQPKVLEEIIPPGPSFWEIQQGVRVIRSDDGLRRHTSTASTWGTQEARKPPATRGQADSTPNQRLGNVCMA